MTSAIVANTIDANFPVAGVDNDSQGFRDNFNVIKTGLSTAASEITTLQDTTAKINGTNNFNGNILDNLVLSRAWGGAYQTTATSNLAVSLTNGEYQLIEVAGADRLITFEGWPSNDKYGRIRLELRSDGTQRTITFATTGGGTVKYEIGQNLAVATGAVRELKSVLSNTTRLTYINSNLTSGIFEVGNTVYGTGITGTVTVSAVTPMTGNATGTTATLTIGYSNIVVGADTFVTMSSSIASVTDGDPVKLASITGVPELSITQTYYAYKVGGDIKLSSSPVSYVAIATTGAYTGGSQNASFPLSGDANTVTIDSTNMYVGMPISFTGTGFGGLLSLTDYFVSAIISGTRIRIATNHGGTAIQTFSTASGTLTQVPRTILTVTWDSGQAVAFGSNLTVTRNAQSIVAPFTVSADTSRRKVIEAWKDPYDNVVYIKFIGEFA
jgi:hypothetical protein